jgi:hypothetical protein
MDMVIQARKRHRANGVIRETGVVYTMPEHVARKLIAHGLAAPLAEPPDWWHAPGRELRTTTTPPPLVHPPVVACLNIWDDLPALEQTAPSWLPHVDALVVADGPYALTGKTGESTDGLRAWLAGCPVACFSVPMPGPCWSDQEVKRTALLQAASRAYPDAMLFIVDADEFVHGGAALRTLVPCDVGWVQVRTPTLYRRRYGQPRLVRAHPTLAYDGRHHWLMREGRVLATHQYGGRGWFHRAVPLALTNQRGLGHTSERRTVKRQQRMMTALVEQERTTGATASDGHARARESLRILQLTSYDAAGVASRLHTAINVTTPHAAVLGSAHDSNPFHYPVQYDLDRDHAALNAVWASADIVHFHLDYRPAARIGRSRDHWKPQTVIHHHGTMYRERPGPDLFNQLDSGMAGLRLVSNLELLQYGEGLHWLPNITPVAEYRALRQRTPRGPGPFRVAHSPSKRHLKGTEVFLRAVERVQAMGLALEPVLIEGQTHADSLTMKAGCDAIFDSFWLGIQCSGLEGAAMGLPVIAGDEHVAAAYRALIGEVPYTFADTEDQLVVILERLVVDTTWRATEAARVAQYVTDYHDEAVVALRYLDLLDVAFRWRTALEITSAIRPDPATPTPEFVQAQEPAVPHVTPSPRPMTRIA